MNSKKVIVFPFMLARVGGLPFSLIEKFRLNPVGDFNSKFEEFQNQLKEVSQNEIIQKGLVQSSHSFFERVEKLKSKPLSSFRKKEYQTERSLFQYFQRTIAKTSPFSTLTTLSPFILSGNKFKNIFDEKIRVNIQFNNQLFEEIKSWSIDNTELLKLLLINVNPTNVLTNNQFVFLSTKEEKLNHVEADEVVQLILKNIDDSISFGELIERLLNQIDADEVALKQYLLKLIDLDLLQINWSVPSNSKNWEVHFLNFLKSLQFFDKQRELIDLFEKLIVLKNRFKISYAKERIEVKNELITTLQTFGLDDIPLKYIFYEDVAKPFPVKIENESIESIVEVCNSFIQFLLPLTIAELQMKVLNFWKKNFQENDSIALLTFYEKFFLEKNHKLGEDFLELKSRRAFYKKEIKKIIKVDENSHCNFSIHELEIIDKKLREKFHIKNKNTQSAWSGHFQFFNENKNAVLNGITPGYGKLFGRFSCFFPKEFFQNQREWNIEPRDELWIQNIDDSIFNAIESETFFSHQIETRNRTDKIKNISLRDLKIEFDKEKNELFLFHKSKNKKVRIFDVDVIAPELRSSMFQLLNCFGVQNISTSIFKNLVNEIVEEEKDLTSRNLRVTIDDKLIIQRKSKTFPIHFFPKKRNKESRESFFQKINIWRKENSIPSTAFFTSIDFENKKFNSSFYKPQLIDFSSPHSIIVFEKIINAKPEFIQIVEMLPEEKDLKKWEREMYVSEFTIQWKQKMMQ